MLLQESTKTTTGPKVRTDGKQMIGGLMKMQVWTVWIFVQWDEQMKQRQPGSNHVLFGMETCLFYVYLDYLEL